MHPLHIERRSSSFGQVLRQRRVLSVGDDSPRSTIHFPDARERHAHQPAPAFARAALERDHRAERHQIAAHVIDRRYRQQSRLSSPSPARMRDAADRLHDAVEAAALAPRSGAAPCAQGHADDPGAHLRAALRREAARGERPRTIGLREYVASRTSARSLSGALLRAQVQMRGTACRRRYRAPTCPESGRCCAVIFSTSAPCSASARAQVGPASTRVRSSTRTPESGRVAARQRFRRCVADALDLEQRLRGDGLRLRMLRPFAQRSRT